MSIKATLKIQLFANDVIVAESENEHLWRQVLTAMQSDNGKAASSDTALPDSLQEGTANGLGEEKPNITDGKGVSGLASKLGVSTSELVGACDPTGDAPYMHLDHKCWEAFKKNTPARGQGAVGPSQLVGTLLCLWFMKPGVGGKPTQAQTLDVLEGIGVTDKNASRSIKNCAWLQSRADGIQINAAQISQAEKIAKAFILKQSIGSE